MAHGKPGGLSPGGSAAWGERLNRQPHSDRGSPTRAMWCTPEPKFSTHGVAGRKDDEDGEGLGISEDASVAAVRSKP